MIRKPDILKGIDLPTDAELLEETRRLKISLASTDKPKSEEAKRNMSKSRKGFKPSEETKRKMSKLRKGRPNSEETNRKISKSSKGKVFSEEHCNNLSKALTGGSNGPHSEESKKKMSEASKGRPKSEEHCNNLSKAHRGVSNGPHSEKTKRKMREAAKNRPIPMAPHKTPYGIYRTVNDAVKGFQLENPDVIMNAPKMRRWVRDPNNLEYYKITNEEYLEYQKK